MALGVHQQHVGAAVPNVLFLIIASTLIGFPVRRCNFTRHFLSFYAHSATINSKNRLAVAAPRFLERALRFQHKKLVGMFPWVND